MAKKTKAEVVKELELLETQYCNLTQKCLDMEQVQALDKVYITNLHESNGKLLVELDNARAKIGAFSIMAKQDQERMTELEVQLEAACEEDDAIQADILEQFGMLKTVIENAEAMLIGQ